MTSDHLSRRQLEEYRAGALPAADLLRADDHLSRCAACRGELAAGVQAADLAAALRAELGAPREDDHLSYEELAAVVDGTADAATRERVDGHVTLCRACADELASLAGFARELGGAVVTPLAPPASAPAGRFLRPLLAMAAAAAVVVAIALLYRDRQPDAPTQASRPPSSLTTDEPESPLAPDPPRSPPVDAVIALADGGGQVTLDRAGNLDGLTADPAELELVRLALETRRPAIDPRVAALQATPGTLLSDDGGDAAFELLAPVATAVETERPTFRWSPAGGATEYRVEVFDADFTPIAASLPVADTSWAPDPPLPRGRTYTWHVVATVGGEEVRSPVPPAPEARFLVLDAPAAEALRASLARHRDSHLVRGLLYARAGLIAEAESELRALEQANPGSAAAAELRRNLAVAR
jgi:hypothetical protein